MITSLDDLRRRGMEEKGVRWRKEGKTRRQTHILSVVLAKLRERKASNQMNFNVERNNKSQHSHDSRRGESRSS